MTLKEQKIALIINLISMYEDCNGAGGSLHIVLDDGNFNDSDLEHCLERSKEVSDIVGTQISELLLEFPKEERILIVETPWDFKKLVPVYELDTYKK